MYINDRHEGIGEIQEPLLTIDDDVIFTETIYAEGIGNFVVHSRYDNWSPTDAVEVFDVASDVRYIGPEGQKLEDQLRNIGQAVLSQELINTAWWVELQRHQADVPLIDVKAVLQPPVNALDFVYLNNDGEELHATQVFNFDTFPLSPPAMTNLYSLMLMMGGQREDGDSIVRRVLVMRPTNPEDTVIYYGDDWAMVSSNLLNGEDDYISYLDKLYPRVAFFRKLVELFGITPQSAVHAKSLKVLHYEGYVHTMPRPYEVVIDQSVVDDEVDTLLTIDETGV